jgi:hypothetical protein
VTHAVTANALSRRRKFYLLTWNKVRSRGFTASANSIRVNDLRAAELGAHDRQFSRGALAGYAPSTENGGLAIGAIACELNPLRHLDV